MGTRTTGTSTAQDRWGRRVIAAALRRLGPRLSAGLRLAGCRIVRRGRYWRLELSCRLPPAPGAPAGGTARPGPELRGCGRARPERGWLPGDPRLGRCLQLALAEALAQVVERSGRGLRLFRARPVGGEGGGGGIRPSRASCPRPERSPPAGPAA